MNEYQVSLIIPVYNVENYIRESLLSALGQTFGSIEYILVDDCGTDHSMEIACSIVDGHPRRQDVRIVSHDRNRGLSAARNTGITAAAGRYVFFMDSDDELTPDCIERHYMVITQSSADFTIANMKLIGSKSIHIKDISDDCISDDLLSSFLKKKWNVSAWNKLYLKNFLTSHALSFQEGLIFEDILWSYNLCLHTDKVAWIRERTYLYKIRKNSITVSRSNSQKIESLLSILNKLVDDWEQGIISRKYTKEFAYMIDFSRLNTALLLLHYSGNREEAASYYRQLCVGRLASLPVSSRQAIVLKLPFVLFCVLMHPLYYLYRILNK